MKAIILAAGEGSRLGQVCKDKPKCLVDIEDNTLLEIQINTLHSCGIEDISIVRGYKAEKINIPGLKYYDNHDYANTNMLHSLFCAREEMTEELLILYSDIIYEEEVIKRLIETSYDLAIGVLVNWEKAIQQRSTISLQELEMVYFNSENRVQKISKNLTNEDETQGQFIGMVRCSRWGAEVLKRNYDRARDTYRDKPFGQVNTFKKAWLTDLLQEMSELGIPLHCTIIERGWMEIDTTDDYERVLKDTQFVRRLIKMKTNWNHRAQFYNRLKWTSADELLSNMVETAMIQQGQKVLDLGTGTGKVLIALKEKCLEADYYGIDISQGMLDKIDINYGFNLSICNIESLHFQDNSFDVVTARMVLHHADNLIKAMKEVYRVVKPGGRVIICEGNPPDHHSIRFYKDMFRFKEDRITFTVDDLVNVLIRNDFKKIGLRIVVLKNMSLNNWLENSGLPFRNIDIIKKMHYSCDDDVKRAYNMKIQEDDILMDWKFSIVSGVK